MTSHRPSRMESCLRIAAAAGALGLSGLAVGQVGFVPLSTLDPSHSASPEGMSADGSVIVGTDSVGTINRAVRWAGGQILDLGDGRAHAVSPAGDLVVGQTQGYFAFRWSEATGMVYLDTGGGGASPPQTTALATNGTVIVGAASGQLTMAAIWGTDGRLYCMCSQGTTLLVAKGISTSGSVACVNGISDACRWTAPGSAQSLGNLPNYDWVTGISGDGAIIVGDNSSAPGSTDYRAFRWTQGTGLVLLPLIAGTSRSFAMAISTDGGTIAGSVLGTTESAALWRADGPHLLADLLAPYNVVPPGWRLTKLTAISSNGLVVAGYGDTGAQVLPFVAYLPGYCYANCDQSAAPPILNANDFQCFLNKFNVGSPYANCDNSTSPPILNVNDFQCFLNQFAAGCS